MREFIYFSKKARTSGNIKDLMAAGRLDIACHSIIMAFFVSNAMRKNIRMHLVFYGPPDPPKHLEITNPKIISKKDISGLIKRMLYKYKKSRRNEVFSGCWIEKKNFSDIVEDLSKKGRTIYLLDAKGEDIRTVEIDKNPVFIFGDQEGIPKQELRRIKNKVKKISVGQIKYFSSQTLAIVQNELDRREVY